MAQTGYDRTSQTTFLYPLITSIIGVFLLLTEDFGSWQDRNPFFGVTEGYIWIGSTKAAPWAQICILTLTAGLTYCAYIAYTGYREPASINQLMHKRAYQSALAVTGLTIVFGVIFAILVLDSDWWWFGTGFYGALISGAITSYLMKRTI
jgi:hypothetical protein